MPLLEILSAKKRLEYEQVPLFQSKERKYFFALPKDLEDKIESYSGITNKVGFRLMFGYFLATKRFFPREAFDLKDIRCLCNQYGSMPFAFDPQNYKRSTYTRHRQVILRHFAFQAYQATTHTLQITQAIKKQLYSWEAPNLIFTYLLEWLEHQRIERPTYHQLQQIITKAIRYRDQQTKQTFSALLQEQQQVALDTLLEKHLEKGQEQYRFMWLQKLSPSDAPTQIKVNVAKLSFVQAIYQTIEPLLDKLGLNSSAIRHFGELVRHTKSSHLLRKTSLDRYFHLALFCAYQRCNFEDWMTQTFVSVCKSSLSKATNKEKEYLFEHRHQQRKAFKTVVAIAQNSAEILEQVRQIAWMDISAHEKEQQLQRLLPQSNSQCSLQCSVQPLQQPPNQQQLEQLRVEQEKNAKDNHYKFLAQQSQSLQQRASPILKVLTFKNQTLQKPIGRAIQYFRERQGQITATAPIDFLRIEEQEALVNQQGKFNSSLYKILLFQKIKDAINRGHINLKYTYKYKDMEDFLIPKQVWKYQAASLLKKANLTHLNGLKTRIEGYKRILHHHFQYTNERIIKGENKYFRRSKNNNYHVITPKVEKEEIQLNLFPQQATIPLSEVLATVDEVTHFLEYFEHLQPLYRKKRPDKSSFFAGITAYGCNIGISAMTKSVSHLRASQLENTINWYFNLAHITKANDAISNFIDQLPLANLQRKAQQLLYTASDGQRIRLAFTNTIFANYSTKYFRKGKGVVAYSFVDERYIPFYATIIDASVREATFVLDGLLHNEVIPSSIHTTDSHGYTEALFGLMDLLGFGFSPNIAKMLSKTLYTFKEHRIAAYRSKGYVVLPKAYIDLNLIQDYWDDVLRLLVSLKFKHCTASQIFRRFNSYQKQHPLYAAIKEYGKLPKTVHILRFTDDLEMRQDSRKSGNTIESSNRFSNAIFFANGGEMIFLTRTEQQIANACKNLIKNAIICWNYLYLTRQVQQTKTEAKKQQLIKAIQSKTVNAWGHIHFTGTYDFSEENCIDSCQLLHSQNYKLD